MSLYYNAVLRIEGEIANNQEFINETESEFNRWGNENYEPVGGAAILLFLDRRDIVISGDLLLLRIRVELVEEDFTDEDINERLREITDTITEYPVPLKIIRIDPVKTTSRTKPKRRTARKKTTHKYHKKYEAREYSEEHLMEIFDKLKQKMDETTWTTITTEYAARLDAAEDADNLDGVIQDIVDEIYDNYYELLD